MVNGAQRFSNVVQEGDHNELLVFHGQTGRRELRLGLTWRARQDVVEASRGCLQPMFEEVDLNRAKTATNESGV